MSARLISLLWLTGAWPAFSQTSPLYAWTNFAGQPGGWGNTDGTGSAARFNIIRGLAVDSTGNLLVADQGNHAIRKVTPAGVVTTLAGKAGASGHADGTGDAARFIAPRGVAVDRADNLFVAEAGTIRKVTPAGVVTTLAGSAGQYGSADGTGDTARFNWPSSVAVDSAGNLYVADTENSTIRKVTPAGVVTTLAGSAGVAGTNDGPASAARFNHPRGVAVDSAGNVFVADDSHTLRKLTPGGMVTTLAGSARHPGQEDGVGNAARFTFPFGVAVDSAGNVLVADQGNATIRKVTSAGAVTTLAGSAKRCGSVDGIADAARFGGPSAIAVDKAGNAFVADSEGATIRKVTSAGVVTTLAGSFRCTGHTDGTGSMAQFRFPSGVAVDSAGNLFVADEGNGAVRKVTPAGAVTTLASRGRSKPSKDGPARAALGNYPTAVAVDSEGNVFVVDRYDHTLRKVSPAGEITTLAGEPGASGSNDGPGSAARFKSPRGVAVDRAGSLFVADSENCTIRKVTPAGEVTTLAGQAGARGDVDGPGEAARFRFPFGVAVDGAGNLFVADLGNGPIRKVTPAGAVTTLAGEVGGAYGVAVDDAGNVFVADHHGHTIRMVTPAGIVTTIGGVAGVMDGRDGVGGAARFAAPSGVAVDKAGNLYVADELNNRITKGVPVHP